MASNELSLEKRIGATILRVSEITGLPLDSVPGDLDSAQHALTATAERLRLWLRTEARARPDGLELCELACDLGELAARVAEQRSGRRGEALRHVQEALSRLRGVQSVSQLMDRAAYEVCHSCCFERAAVFRVECSSLIAESMYFRGDPEGAARFLALARERRPRLERLLLETEMVRRRVPVLVDAAGSIGRND